MLQASWPVLHTAYRTSQGARRISRAACGTVSHDASCTLRSIFPVPFPAPSSPVPVGTVSTQIASWQACTVPLVGAGGARARCRLATAPLVRNVSAINDISWRIPGRTSDVERGTCQRTWQGTCHASPRTPMILCQLQPTTNADGHRDADLVSGCACRGELRGCSGSGAPFGLDGLGNVVGENQRLRCCTALAPVARPSSRCLRERAWRGVVGPGRRELAPCDAEGDNRADYCARLGKARGANEYGAAAEGRVIFRWTRLSSGGVVWDPRAGVGIRGRTQRTSCGFGVTPEETHKHQLFSHLEGWGGRRRMRQPR